MIIYFHSKQRVVCRKIADILEKQGHVCSIYTVLSQFYGAVSNMNKKPDLLVLDYTAFNHDVFNVYRFMQEQECQIPLIFYNDPIPSPSERVFHWLTALKVNYTDKVSFDPGEYKPVLQIISDAVDSDLLHPYISLLQLPLPFPDPGDGFGLPEKIFRPDGPERDLLTIRRQLSLSDSLFEILKMFYEHRGITVTMEFIEDYFRRKDLEHCRSTLYSYISRLRTLIASYSGEGELDLSIIRVRGGYKLIT